MIWAGGDSRKARLPRPGPQGAMSSLGPGVGRKHRQERETAQADRGLGKGGMHLVSQADLSFVLEIQRHMSGPGVRISRLALGIEAGVEICELCAWK